MSQNGCRKGYKSKKSPKVEPAHDSPKITISIISFSLLCDEDVIPNDKPPSQTRPICVCLIHYTRCQRCSRALADVSNFSVALVTGEKSNFQFILRLLNTNVDGKQKVMYALTKIKGVGRRYSNLVCKKADVDLNKRYVKNSHLSLDLVVARGIAQRNKHQSRNSH